MHAHARDCVRAHAHGRTNTTFFSNWMIPQLLRIKSSHNCYGLFYFVYSVDNQNYYGPNQAKLATDQVEPTLLRIEARTEICSFNLIFRNCTCFLEIMDIGFFNTKAENLRNDMPILQYSSWNLVKLHADSFKVRPFFSNIVHLYLQFSLRFPPTNYLIS